MKFALVVGHTQAAQGAVLCAPYQFVSEYEYNTILAGIIHRKFLEAGHECEVIFRDKGGVALAYSLVKAYAPACAVELHFNASSNADAAGTETLHGEGEPARKLAGAVHVSLCRALGRVTWGDRGAKPVQKGMRGYENVNNGSGVPSCLVEPFFGSNRRDAILALEKIQDIAHAIFKGMANFALTGA